ncbi:hypothetical protein VCR26J2_40038 [Vibrio coralliirubri]|nr:hypothetical protein VCR6J2_70017 [Vibrio coralliirubri]CDT82738.1 hypothetical protein VCR26J2_40038 [Vibrio coralliirubri]
MYIKVDDLTKHGIDRVTDNKKSASKEKRWKVRLKPPTQKHQPQLPYQV